MFWKFAVRLASKRALPAEDLRYTAIVEAWLASDALSSNTAALLEPAALSLAITTRQGAANHLKDQGLAEGEDREISFAQYWPSHDSEAGSLFAVTLGLASDRLSQIRQDLDQAFYHGFRLTVTAYGGFSTVDPNPLSKQPTEEKFAAGLPLPLSDIGIVVDATTESAG